jgi:hypothetical protein
VRRHRPPQGWRRGWTPKLVRPRARKRPREIFAVFQTALAGLPLSMADPQIMTLVTVVIGVGFAVTILRNNRMRSLSVATIFVVGYVLSAVAQNSTPKLNNRATQVAPNPEPPWPVKPPWPERPATQVAPNHESSLSEELDKAAMQVLKELENPTTQAIHVPPNLENLWLNPAMQTLKSLAPQLENPTTQTIPNPSAPIRPKTR